MVRSASFAIRDKRQMKVKDYKDLKVWQKGIEIVDKVYILTAKFPKEELYGLTLQMRKAAVSIPSNVSEGFVRGHTNEYRQFLRISVLNWTPSRLSRIEEST
jgi:hypothetical protein